MSAPAELVHLDVAHDVATITLDSPGNRNALSLQLQRELDAHLATAIATDQVRVVVLTHAGPVFCSGIELTEPNGDQPDDTFGMRMLLRILTRIWDSPKPVIARVAGSARAGGVALVAACDIAVATKDATFAFNEVRIGVVPALISVTVLPRLLPRAAHEFFLTGEAFRGRQAVEIGLVNSTVPAFELDAEVRRYIDALRKAAPGAVAATKRLLRHQHRNGLDDELTDMLTLSVLSFTSEEGREGVAAFLGKRLPTWAAPPTPG